MQLNLLKIKKGPTRFSQIGPFESSPTHNKVRTYFSVIWHVETVLNDLGQQKLSLIRSDQVKKYPFLEDANFRLTPLLIVNSPKLQKQKNKVDKKLSRAEQKEIFTQLINDGEVNSRADLSRKFGVSRAWVTKVLNN